MLNAPAVRQNSTQAGNAAHTTTPASTQVTPAPAPRVATSPHPPAQLEQQAGGNATPDELDAIADEPDDWADAQWTDDGTANGTTNDTDAGAATDGGSQGGEQSGADWRILYLVLGVILGTAAGVGVLMGGCHSAGVCEGASTCQDCQCSGSGFASGSGGEGVLACLLGILLLIVLVAAAAVCFCIGWGVGFVLVSALGLLCPITRECQRCRDDLTAPPSSHSTALAAARAAAAVQLPSAKVTLSSDAGKPFGGGSSQECEAPPAMRAPLPSPTAPRLDAPLPADMV